MARRDDLERKWKPITKWIPNMQRAQAKVLAEENIWVPLDRMCAHSGIETGYTGNPNIISVGVNACCPNPGTQCSGDCRAHGLFQIYWPPFSGVNWNKIYDPDYNCYLGARVLAVRYKQCGRNWRGASMAFFSGSCVDIGVIDNSTGTSQARYDQAMRENIAELNELGIGTGEDGDLKAPQNPGNGNTGTDRPKNPDDNARCITIPLINKEICGPSTEDLRCLSIPGLPEICAPQGGDIQGAFIENIVEPYFLRGILLIIGLSILVIGLRAVT